MGNPLLPELDTLLSSLISFDSVEKEQIALVKHWIRLQAPLHWIASFVVVDPSTQELLLVKDAKEPLWHPPNTDVKQAEPPREAVKRGAKAQLGIEADFLFEDPVFLTLADPTKKRATLWYVLRQSRQTTLRSPLLAQWFDWSALPYTEADPHLKRFVEKTLKKFVTLNSYEISALHYEKNTASLHPKEEAGKFIRKLPLHAKILDIGCGPGRDAKIFSELGFDVVGIDFSPKMIEIAKQNVPQASFYVMDIENLTLSPHSFEGVWANCSLLHVPKKNLPAVLHRIHTLLKPSGFFYLCVKRSAEGEVFERDPRYDGLEKYWSFYEPEELTALLIEAGFSIVDAMVAGKSTDYQTHPVIRILAQKQPQ